mmetsp:Transcript_10978/g.20883  ORF Transcript_10978/g.20883 Transcript_10978/m.20883 type:complete len:231 (-) Transcript_10978:401-1093(-)
MTILPQDKHTVGCVLDNLHPGLQVKRRGFDQPGHVAEQELASRPPERGHVCLREGWYVPVQAAVVEDVVAVRHHHQSFREPLRVLVCADHMLVHHVVVDKRGPGGGGKGQVRDRHRCRFHRQHVQPLACRMVAQVDEDVDPQLPDRVGHVDGGQPTQLRDVGAVFVGAFGDGVLQVDLGVDVQAPHLIPLRVVCREHLVHLQAHGVVEQVMHQKTNTQGGGGRGGWRCCG